MEKELDLDFGPSRKCICSIEIRMFDNGMIGIKYSRSDNEFDEQTIDTLIETLNRKKDILRKCKKNSGIIIKPKKTE